MTELFLRGYLIEAIKEKGVTPYVVQKEPEDTKMADVVVYSPKNEMIMGFIVNPDNLEKPYTFVHSSQFGGMAMSLEDVKEFMTGFGMGEELRFKEEIV